MKVATMDSSLLISILWLHMDEETQSMGCLSSVYQMTLGQWKENLSALGFVLEISLNPGAKLSLIKHCISSAKAQQQPQQMHRL